MHEVINRLGSLSLPRKSVVRLTDRPDMTLDVYCGRKTTKQQLLKFLLYTCTLSTSTCMISLYVDNSESVRPGKQKAFRG